ncbi:MAG: hypothetical protein O2816_19135, partial [Planctomycetota bacterium]|nr:hypothetical protein [Planctomycetota bacterium]
MSRPGAGGKPSAPRSDPEPDLPLAADILAHFSTRSFSGNPGRTIALTVIVGLSAFQVAPLADAHPFVLTAVLLGAMVFVITRRAGHALYVLTPDGIHQEVQFLQAFGGRAPRRRFLPFTAIRAHRAGGP